jgi:hypothetical protein
MIIVARTKEGAESEYAKSKGKGGMSKESYSEESSRMIAIREILNRIFVVPLNGEN